MLANIKFKAIEDLKKIRAEVSGHTESYSAIEGCIRQSTDNPINQAEVITMKEFINIINNLDSDNSK